MPYNDDAEKRNSETAVVVLGHGSRAADSGRPLEWVAALLDDYVDCRVEPAFLQFNQPGLEECCRELAADGIREIFIAPYFLFMGNHIREDIPKAIASLEVDYPGVSFKLTGTLGTDDNLVRLLLKRLREAGLAPGVNGSFSSEVHPIERESFSIIDAVVAPADSNDPEYRVARRVVHATGDVGLIDSLSFSPGAIAAAGAAFSASARVYCDVNMVAAGIGPTAARAELEVLSSIADAATRSLAAAEGITRSAASLRRFHNDGSGSLEGAVIVIGNAPTALFELLRLVREEGLRPALVIGVPVGFVGAAESKEELAASDLEHVTMPGTRGGSNVAAAIFNALVRQWNGGAGDGS